ncbi:MAG TPA: S1/P1 nuclease, partial [Longimicrobiales bacterium]|nr:S1/P1 nuclease [Longimicrobiales bacterium]
MKLTARFGLVTAFVTIPILPHHDWAVWGGDGHRLVCEIAWRQLTPKARAFIDQLRAAEAVIPFAHACTWADDIRRDRPETAAYHFVNIPPGVSGIDLARDCAHEVKRCAPWAIKHYTKILADTGASTHDRLEALKFVSHFVGDLHQPLHAGRLEDLGGNKVYVSFFGDRGSERSPMQLHRVWDSGILARAHLRWPAAVRPLLDSIRPEDV